MHNNDVVIGGYPIRDKDGKFIGHHTVDGEDIMFFDWTTYTEGYEEREPSNVGELRECRYFVHPTKKTHTMYAGSLPRSQFVYVNLTCPLCGSPTESFSDCPGYRGGEGRVMVCGNFYDDETITGKNVFASACGNSDLYVCINPDCDWEWRTHNRRGSNGVDPAWKDHAESYDHFGSEDDDDDV